MAKTTIIQLVDDLDGSEASETVKFGLDGQTHEIDLSTKNADKLRKALAPFVDKATRIPNSRYSARKSAAASHAAREERDRIRAWALRKGMDVAPRGQIRGDIIEAYRKDAQKATAKR